jgi:RNA polymerase-interacting CarD/CdnL/TRCF family regulator
MTAPHPLNDFIAYFPGPIPSAGQITAVIRTNSREGDVALVQYFDMHTEEDTHTGVVPIHSAKMIGAKLFADTDSLRDAIVSGVG